jgi:Photosynthetic reaction centre cytochrome C subunit
MMLGSRTFRCAASLACLCLLSAAALRAQTATPATQISDTVFKNVQLLKGIPVDTFFDAMGMFANAMGNDCTFCHSPKAALDRNEFAVATPRIQRARQMIVMVNTINKMYFAGQPRVTCFTCHHGNQSPRSDPNFALQYGPPIPDPIARDFPTDTSIMPSQVFDKHLQAIGGAAAASKLTSFTAKGTYEGFDTAFEKLPVEIFARAPNQFATVVHMSAGDSRRVYNGAGGWLSGPDTAIPVINLTGGNLDRARLEALVAFPASLRTAFPQWRAGRTADEEHEYIVLQGNENGQPVVNLYFDEDGMLARLVRFTVTPVGFVPTQIDYSDYRAVAGVKMAFKKVVSQTYMQMTVELTDVQPNVAIDASRFAQPRP